MPGKRQVLTDLVIRGARPPGSGQVELWDAQVSGLVLRVSQGGTKTFALMYYANGRRRRLTLGKHPGLSLAKARARAHGALEVIAEGGDPASQKTAARLHASRTGFAGLVEEFIEKYARPRNRDWRETQRILEREFGSRWNTRSVSDITKEDMIAAIDSIVARGSPGSAARSFAIVRRFFNWCAERGVVGASPCQGLRSPVAPSTRDRVLSKEELAAVWKAAGALDYPFGRAVQLLALTAQRKSEVVGCKWSELDLQSSTWTIGAERNKSKRKHTVPLVKLATEIIALVPRTSNEWVFPTARGEGPISGFSKWKLKLDDMSGVAEWRLHDLRRTAATHMASLGVAPHVIERILNHTTGTLGGVAGIYNRFQYLPEMRAALELWADEVGKLTGSR